MMRLHHISWISRKARLILLCQIGPVPPDMAYFGANTPRFRPRFSRLSLKHGGSHLSDKIVLRESGSRNTWWVAGRGGSGSRNSPAALRIADPTRLAEAT